MTSLDVLTNNVFDHPRSNSNSTFWSTLERAYDLQIPTYVKNILRITGYGNPISFQRITPDTLEQIEIFVRTSVSFPLPADSREEDYFGHFFVNKRNLFTFTPGDRDLVLGLVDRVKEYTMVFQKLLNY
ncbi:hypothetical protein TKK_0011518 [Trichogramma kaykai]|uniref:Uncharacterized protein n=1 Tax=Trichogramma kaykai TaxID=54128 RepID=A0ABD2WSH3_9HYME